MAFLLDTNVLSEARRKRPDPNVQAWFASVSGSDLFLSVLVIGEIRRGIEALRGRDPARVADIDGWLAGLTRHYGERILPVTAEIAEEWGRLGAPNRVSCVDGLLAATARVHRLTLVTRNTADVARAGVPVLNPFEPAGPQRASSISPR